MRAREFVAEAIGVMTDYQSEPMRGSELVRDGDQIDRTYHMNRLMMAMAMADGKDRKPVNIDDCSWTEKYNTVHPYTEEEHNMLHQAMGAINTDHVTAAEDHRSLEPKDTYKTSPIKGFKGYPR